jgi:hypothetical protein
VDVNLCIISRVNAGDEADKENSAVEVLISNHSTRNTRMKKLSALIAAMFTTVAFAQAPAAAPAAPAKAAEPAKAAAPRAAPSRLSSARTETVLAAQRSAAPVERAAVTRTERTATTPVRKVTATTTAARPTQPQPQSQPQLDDHQHIPSFLKLVKC